MRTYSDLLQHNTFEDRLAYLRTDSVPSEITFGGLRHINQKFYNSTLWRRTRRIVIARDLGFDLAIPGRDIFGKVIVHHMNPLVPNDLFMFSERALNPDFLITVSHGTHQAIHFGSKPQEELIERYAGDTKLW